MITTAPRRETTLSFPIEKVKSSLAEVTRLSDFRLTESNPTFNIYKVSVVHGFWTGLINITLNPVNDASTHCVFEIYNTIGGSAAPSQLNSLQDYFLKYLAASLEGKSLIPPKPITPAISEEVLNKNKRHQRIAILLLILLVVAAIAYSLIQQQLR